MRKKSNRFGSTRRWRRRRAGRGGEREAKGEKEEGKRMPESSAPPSRARQRGAEATLGMSAGERRATRRYTAL